MIPESVDPDRSTGINGKPMGSMGKGGILKIEILLICPRSLESDNGEFAQWLIFRVWWSLTDKGDAVAPACNAGDAENW